MSKSTLFRAYAQQVSKTTRTTRSNYKTCRLQQLSTEENQCFDFGFDFGFGALSWSELTCLEEELSIDVFVRITLRSFFFFFFFLITLTPSARTRRLSR